MKRIVNILFAIWIVLSAYAVDYRPVHLTAPPSGFSYQRSAVSGQSSVFGGLASNSRSGLSSNSAGGLTSNRANGLTSNPSSISAANFEALNSEGGACYQPAYAPGVRKVRPGDEEGGGGGAIGEYDFHSPVGNTPWLLTLIMLLAYVLKKRLFRKA